MSIEAMKQALEEIRQAKLQGRALERNEMLDAASSFILQAIEQAEKQEHHAKDCALLQIPSRDCDCSQNQEPVALDSIRLVVLETDHPADKMPIESQRLFAAGWNAAIDALKKRGPLYPAPQPQREWVGLTDEEVKHMLELFVVPPHHVEMVVKAIEAKLKEKNT